MSELSTKQVNSMFFEKLSSDDAGQRKVANEAVQDWTRTKMREDGFMRKVLPPIPISNEDLDRQLDSDRNWVIVDKEVEGTPAMSVPYNSLPIYKYIESDRYAVPIERMQTDRYTKDLSTMRTDRMDVRQVLANNVVKDLLAEEDGKFISLVDTICADSAEVQQTIIEVSDGTNYADRIAVNDALKLLPRLSSHVPCTTLLINSIMVNDFQKWGLDELGSDLAGEIALNGWAERNLFGKRLIITIKRDLVGDDVMYMFSEPKFMGKSFVLQDATMHMERKDGYMIEFFSYQELGCAFGNTLSVGKAGFYGTEAHEADSFDELSDWGWA
jgi:hypothetical protein